MINRNTAAETVTVLLTSCSMMLRLSLLQRGLLSGMQALFRMSLVPFYDSENQQMIPVSLTSSCNVILPNQIHPWEVNLWLILRPFCRAKFTLGRASNECWLNYLSRRSTRSTKETNNSQVHLSWILFSFYEATLR